MNVCCVSDGLHWKAEGLLVLTSVHLDMAAQGWNPIVANLSTFVWGIKHFLCIQLLYPVFFPALKKKIEENGIDFKMICLCRIFRFFFKRERRPCFGWWSFHLRKYGEIFEAQTGAVVTCLLDRQNPRRSSISPVTEKLPCYFFLCSDLLSLIVGLGWVVLKKGVPFSFQNPLFFFKVQWWFSTHQHEHYTRPP